MKRLMLSVIATALFAGQLFCMNPGTVKNCLLVLPTVRILKRIAVNQYETVWQVECELNPSHNTVFIDMDGIAVDSGKGHAVVGR